MVRPTIEDFRQLAPFATLYRWNFNMTPPQAVSVDPALLNLRCESATEPEMTGAPAEIQLRGHTVRDLGLFTYAGTITLTFLETIDNVVYDFFQRWREACWKAIEGTQLSKQEVEATIFLDRLDNQDNEIWHYKIIGCWHQGQAAATMDAATDRVTVSITVAYDYFLDGPGASG